MKLKKIISVFVDFTLYAVGILFVVFLIYVLLQIFVYGSFTIPSDSMQPGIIPGDKVIVEKVSTGARLFDYRKAAHGEKFEVRRTPHWREFKRGDILVFNFVHRDTWDSIMFNWPVYYIKRCIAVPGDTVNIEDFRYVVNGEELKGYPQSKEMLRFFPSDSAARVDFPNIYRAMKEDTVNNWTIRNLGPLTVPGKGMKMILDRNNYFPYRQLIERETGKKLSMKDDKFFLDSLKIEDYTFKENYYFMAGDNIPDSQDSRYWGLLPEDFIVGRARFIWWSGKDGKIRWERILKPLK